MENKKEFLGRGWAFPVHLDSQSGAVATAAFEDDVKQAIRIILGTAPGERVMRPDFGCGIYDLVFEMTTASTAGRISQAVREALLKFEPRIDVLDIQVKPVLDDEGAQVLSISIDYQVRATNNAFNLVYPFYLERSPG